MKESRFIELVNLYIDRQIAPEEAAELEAELKGNPARRRTYHQYCRMHHATKLVFASFRAHAPAEPTAGDGEAGAIAHLKVEHRRRHRRWAAYAAGIAAAACVVFPVARIALNGSKAPAPVPIATHSSPRQAPVAQTTVAIPVVPDVIIRSPQFVASPGLASLRSHAMLEAVVVPAPGVLVLSNQPLPVSVAQPQVRLQPLFDDGVFDAPRSGLLPAPANQRIFQGRGPVRQQVEFTGFQFQR